MPEHVRSAPRSTCIDRLLLWWLAGTAIEALDEAVKTRAVRYVVQCDGYIFKLALLSSELIEQEQASQTGAASPKESK
jgi:hypothetical protein